LRIFSSNLFNLIDKGDNTFLPFGFLFDMLPLLFALHLYKEGLPLMITLFVQFLQKFFFIFIGVCGLGSVIALHEFGHFIFCKIFSIYTPSFSIGMGPIVVSKKIGTTLFKISAIPLGGYVEIAEKADPSDPQANAHGERYFSMVSWWQKLLVMIGGILFNVIFAYSTFVLLFVIGAPKTPLLYPTIATTQVIEVKADSAAYGLGIRPGYELIEIDGKPCAESIDLLLRKLGKSEFNSLVFKQYDFVEPFKPYGLNPTSEAVLPDLHVHLPSPPNIFEQSALAQTGMVFGLKESKPLPFFTALRTGIREANRWIANTARDFLHLFKKKNIDQMAGPLMIVAMSTKMVGLGFGTFLLFLAIISINLAVLNLIPLPILDGGQIALFLIELVIRRPLPDRAREAIHITCWIAFLVLFVYLSWYDIRRIIGF
jgi:regulator of sigma E protease